MLALQVLVTLSVNGFGKGYNDMNLYNIEEGIDRTLVGGASILCTILSILLLVGLLIGLFGLLTFIVILLGLGSFLFLSYWVGKWFIG